MATATHATYRAVPDVAQTPPGGIARPDVERPGRPPAGESREDRIASVFGRSCGAGLPPVSAATLLAYHEYLRRRLSIPFKAEYCALDDRTVHGVTVVGLLSPMRPGLDLERGLVCLARSRGIVLVVPLVDLEVSDDAPNFQLLEDYWYWAWNWGQTRAGRRPV